LRRLIVILLIGAAFWSGYWYVGKSAKYLALNAWLESRREAGWTAEYTDFRVVGFPNRFDSRFTDLHLMSPETGLGWQAPRFHILALSYKPNHIIAAFADSQMVSFPGENVTILSRDMLASVVFEPDTNLAIDRIQLAALDFALDSDQGWQAQAGSLSFSTRQNDGTDLAHDVVFDAKKITPTQEIRATLDPKHSLPATIETMFLDLKLDFDAPWDRIALETGAPDVTKIVVNNMKMAWGVLSLSASGDLDVAQDGIVSGKLNLKILNWRGVLDLTVTSGLIDRATADKIATGLTLLTLGSDNPDSLSIPLTLDGGRMSLGPIPLGFAPRFIR
jgi:hypothetical protein